MENIKIGVEFLLDVSIVNPYELENQKKVAILSKNQQGTFRSLINPTTIPKLTSASNYYVNYSHWIVGVANPTRHDTKLAGYRLRLNGFVSYSG